MKRLIFFICSLLIIEFGIAVFLLMVDNETKFVIIDKLLSLFGLDSFYNNHGPHYLMFCVPFDTSLAYLVYYAVVFLFFTPVVLAVVFYEIFSYFLANKDTRKFRYNERAKKIRKSMTLIAVVRIAMLILLPITPFLALKRIINTNYSLIKTIGIIMHLLVSEIFIYYILKILLTRTYRIMKNLRVWR